MNNIIFNKRLYYINDENYAFIKVTQENNGFFIWLETSGNEIPTSIIDYHTYDRDRMIEKAVDISRIPFDKIITLINKKVALINT